MSRNRWHISRTEDALTLSRQVPARFDIVAETVLPVADPARLARQIRQDIWRALQKVRGFSPVVEIATVDARLVIRAGGQLCGRPAQGLAAQISAVLEDPKNRARWLRFAGRRDGGMQ